MSITHSRKESSDHQQQQLKIKNLLCTACSPNHSLLKKIAPIHASLTQQLFVVSSCVFDFFKHSLISPHFGDPSLLFCRRCSSTRPSLSPRQRLNPPFCVRPAPPHRLFAAREVPPSPPPPVVTLTAFSISGKLPGQPHSRRQPARHFRPCGKDFRGARCHG